MSDMSHLNFSLILLFLVSQTYSEKPNFLMFVIFLLTQSSAIFTSCGLLVQSHLSAAVHSHCSQLLSAAATVTATAGTAAVVVHNKNCSPSAATVHSCCAPLLPPPPLPLPHSRHPLPPSTVAVRCRCHHCHCHWPNLLLPQCNVCRSWYIIKNR